MDDGKPLNPDSLASSEICAASAVEIKIEAAPLTESPWELHRRRGQRQGYRWAALSAAVSVVVVSVPAFVIAQGFGDGGAVVAAVDGHVVLVATTAPPSPKP